MAKQSVLVIGAGMAGLSAARLLHDTGYPVTIIEGRNRAGGRIHTNHDLGVALDLGASWIHRIEGNPISQLAKKLNIKTQVTDYESVMTYDYDGQAIADAEINRLYAKFEALMEKLNTDREEIDDDTSLEIGIRSLLENEKLTPTQKQLLDYMIVSEIEHDTAANTSDLSLWYWDQDEEFGGDDVIFPNGYHQLIEHLADGIDIRYEEIVTEIIYDKQQVTVKTENSNQYEARYAIVTLPLGVLKSDRVKFSPELPKAKRKAIQKLGMGHFNKVYLRFPNVFWEEDAEFLGYASEKSGEWVSWMNYMPYSGEPILVAFNTGKFGEQVEQLSEKEAIQQAMAVLKTMYGNNIPEPTNCLITGWGNNPFSLGAYSYVPIGASGKHYKALAKPVKKRLLFAGEATSRKYPATVHGAYLSGKREAERIIKSKI